MMLEFKSNDLTQRRIYGDWSLGKLAEDLLLYQKIVFSDEAHFWLNGYVNKHNCGFWSEDQSKELQKLPVHAEKVTVWCGLWAVVIIGPCFFKDADYDIQLFFVSKMQELGWHDFARVTSTSTSNN